MARALKVYRTAIGFHDAYVAAPSKKAALEAWGSDKDLFARGAAELVDDPKLGAEALAAPGRVIKRLRGTAEEQLAALPPDAPRKPAKASAKTSKPEPKAKPKPSRARLDAAEQALVDADALYGRERDSFAAELATLNDRRRRAEAAQAEERERLVRRRDDAADAYRAALDDADG